MRDSLVGDCGKEGAFVRLMRSRRRLRRSWLRTEEREVLSDGSYLTWLKPSKGALYAIDGIKVHPGLIGGSLCTMNGMCLDGLVA